jgi:hypothetical protein
MDGVPWQIVAGDTCRIVVDLNTPFWWVENGLSTMNNGIANWAQMKQK